MGDYRFRVIPLDQHRIVVLAIFPFFFVLWTGWFLRTESFRDTTFWMVGGGLFCVGMLGIVSTFIATAWMETRGPAVVLSVRSGMLTIFDKEGPIWASPTSEISIAIQTLSDTPSRIILDGPDGRIVLSSDTEREVEAFRTDHEILGSKIKFVSYLC